MNLINSIDMLKRRAVAFLATVVLLIGSSSAYASTMKTNAKSSVMPDFAYPQTVEKNSESTLSEAIARNDWPVAISATIQYVTAANLISNENATDGISRIDSLTVIAPDEWKPAFKLIKAQVYNAIYESIRWKAIDRKLPLDQIPANPYDWSRDIFADRVFSIASDIINAHTGDSTPLKEWNAFITDTSCAYKENMTVGEFLDLQCFKVLRTYAESTPDIIPFFSGITTQPVTPVQKCTDLGDKAIDALISKAASGGQSLLLANAISDKSYTLPYTSRQKYLLSNLSTLKDTEGEQLLLMRLNEFVSDSNSSEEAYPLGTAAYISMLEKSLALNPKGMYSNALRNIINERTRPYVNISYKSQYLSTDSVKMTAQLSNCDQTWLLVYDYSGYTDARRQPKTKEIAAKCRLVKAVKVNVDKGTVPFSKSAYTNVGPLPAGTYVVIPSASSNKNGIYSSIANDTWREPFTISDINVMTLRCPDATTKVFVVDGRCGRPIEGAQVNVYTYSGYGSDKTLSGKLTTDSDGSVTVAEKRFRIEAFYNDSKWSDRTQLYNSSSKSDTATYRRAQLLSDRGIYHPGDSIEAAVILYSSRLNDLNVMTDTQVTVRLLDANLREIAVKEITTDRFGRSAVAFAIPSEGLLGNWQLSATDRNGVNLGSVGFEVSDYVAPTFFVTTEIDETEAQPGDSIKIKGQVLTYSGMPVAGGMVKYSVSYRPPMKWFYAGGATYDSSVTTDSEGRFEINLPTANLKGTAFERGVFNISFSATSAAGETQSGPSRRFALGNEYSISAPPSDTKIDVTDGIPELKFNVFDMLGRNVRKNLNYRLVNKVTGTVAAEGEFMSPVLNLPDRTYASAAYRLEVNLADDKDVDATTEIVIWRQTDSAAPEGTGLWLPQTDIYLAEGAKSADVTVGSGIGDRWIPAVLSGEGKVNSVKWLHVKKDNLSVPVECPVSSETYQLNLSYTSDLETENRSVRIHPSSESDKLEINAETFRDKVTAGDMETWTFRFKRNDVTACDIPAMAVMTDAALNAITPFKWNFNPSGHYSGGVIGMRCNYIGQRNFYANIKDFKYLDTQVFSTPVINDYNAEWGINGLYRETLFYAMAEDGGAPVNGMVKSMQTSSGAAVRSMAMMKKEAAPMMAAGAVMDDMAEESVAEEEQEVSSDTAENTSPASDTPSDLRNAECPVAFFKPYLTSDADGIVSIDFTVPNFNTTWAFQMIGYDNRLRTAKIALEAVASKPVMVSTHSPRFVRSGDKVNLTATAYNNAGRECMIGGRIELVDLLSGKIIAVKDFDPVRMEASASRLLEMAWDVPSDVSAVGVRAYAVGDGHRDGEQTLLPVLPASTPVVESTPFWIAPDGKELSVKLPRFKDTDRVTLQYCDNPAWYCLTALPDIVIPDSKSMTAKAKALFGNTVAYHLISSYPDLRKGLEAMLSDKNSQFAALRSNLEKDGDLKITQLSNTPWVNNAASETLRMSRLSSLLDSVKANEAISTILKEMRDEQTSDGGWRWCPDMEASSFITSEVIRYFAMMQTAGADEMQADWIDMVKSGISFVDREKLKEYEKYHKKGNSLTYLLDWLYVRSCFSQSVLPEGKTGKEMASLSSKAIKDIASEWKEMSISNKAKAAMLLWRNGDRKTASDIMESLRQYASVSANKGMWFDNLSTQYGSLSTLATTTLVLNAFSEIHPGESAIDSIRQWLILGRQYQDWGQNTSTAETVSAILQTGKSWTDPSEQAEFSLGGKKIVIPETAAMTGAFTLTLDAKDASGKTLKVKRSATSPAWGGVISQYVMPIEDVKPADVPDLSIEKRIVPLVEGPDGILQPKEGIELEKGMKVRVTLLIEAGRDLDYVAVTDERSACLEPIDQLSGYTRSDGLGFYREVRDASTNLFFGHLPKGRHVVTYECNVSQEGEYSCGIATAQSQYSPLTAAHSKGSNLKVK